MISPTFLASFSCATICCIAPLAAALPAVYPTLKQMDMNGELRKVENIHYVFYAKPILDSKEGYSIEMKKNGILEICFTSPRGVFYANQTLSQLLGMAQANMPVPMVDAEGKELPLGKIIDAPDIPFRGTVEGFYGQPWSHEARLAQLAFYGRNKLNTYIYGPKNDPFHSANWREAYPEAEAKKIAELASVAKACHVDFYWAIHPGHNIKWIEEDMRKVIDKFELMYDLGVRHFAVFFDDISGEGTRPEMQARLMEMIQTDFVDKKKDVGELIICPTQYNREWSGGDYLDILGTKLNKKIHIMWTGDTVVHDIDLAGQGWINKRLRRPAFIWWNSPVTDYVRNHLCLGRVYGLGQEKEMTKSMTGFVSNPMDKPEASKIALFSVADYSWNITKFNSDASWKAGIRRIYGKDDAAAMQIFAEHHSDIGENFHKFRREESVRVAPLMAKLNEAMKTNTATKEDLSKVQAEFRSLAEASAHLLTTSHASIAEIRPWLEASQDLGNAGVEICNSLLKADDHKAALAAFIKATAALARMENINLKENQNPYQPGIRVGSLVMTPMAKALAAHQAKALAQQCFGKVSGLAKPLAPPSGRSSMKGVETIRANVAKNNIALNPIFEVYQLPAAGVVELILPAAPEVSRASIKFDGTDITQWAQVEMLDADGKSYPCTVVQKHGDGRLDFAPADGKKIACSMLRLRNKSNKNQPVKLSLMSVNALRLPSIKNPANLTDGDLLTTYLLEKGGSVDFDFPAGMQGAMKIIGEGKFRVKILPDSRGIRLEGEGCVNEIFLR